MPIFSPWAYINQMRALFIGLAMLLILVMPVTSGSGQDTSSDWITWGYDQERSGWNRGEATLSPENVSQIRTKVENKAKHSSEHDRIVH